MINLMLDSLWAMEPAAFEKFKAQVSKYDFNAPLSEVEEVTASISAGVADDAQRAGLPLQVSGTTAIIRIAGPIVKNESFLTRFFGFASTRAIQSALASAVADKDIESIVLIIDSPGGTVDGTTELADAVYEARKEKPIIAQVDGMAASAAYWIASQATQVVADRNAMVGSIGVRIMLLDFSAAFEEAGIEAVPIDTGEFKSAAAQGTEITENHKADFQRIVDEYFSEFLGAIERGRNISSNTLRSVADGRMFRGEKALEFGLVDTIQTPQETLASLAHSPEPQGRRITSADRARVALMGNI